MSPRHTTTYLVLTRSIEGTEFVSVPMINRRFTTFSADSVAPRATVLLAAALGVRPDSFEVEVTRVDPLPTQRTAA